MLMTTGIFLYYQQGERLRDFPQALEEILPKENVFLYDAFYPSKPPSSFDMDPLSPEVLCQVLSPEMGHPERARHPSGEGTGDETG